MVQICMIQCFPIMCTSFIRCQAHKKIIIGIMLLTQIHKNNSYHMCDFDQWEPRECYGVHALCWDSYCVIYFGRLECLWRNQCIKPCMLCYYIVTVWSEHHKDSWLDILTCSIVYVTALEVIHLSFSCCNCFPRASTPKSSETERVKRSCACQLGI